ncbi:MAG TPA: hypothetical protein VD866_08065 [Urbifossiella sp.]|nr:hypothetical protein [Urbifossiella sp.]
MTAEINATRFDGSSGTANAALGERYGIDWEYAGVGDSAILVPTAEGKKRCEVGDWVVKNPDGTFRVYRPEVPA